MKNLKSKALALAIDLVQKKYYAVKETLVNLQESLLSETKSTAGDKHETGRAMVQLEMEKTGTKAVQLQEELQVLKRIETDERAHKTVRLGSLVTTSNGLYFIAISLGVVTLEANQVYIISPQAPIGKALLGKSAGDTVMFRNLNITIQSVA